MTLLKSPLQFSCRGATSSGLAPDKARPFGGSAAIRSVMSGTEAFREVSAYSGFPRAWGAGCSDAELQNQSGSKLATGQILQRIRKSFDLPALVAIARAKCHPLEFVLQQRPVDPAALLYSFTRTNSPARALLLFSPAGSVLSLLLLPTRCDGLAPEIWTQFSVTRIATGLGPTIAWKASPTRTPPPICTFRPLPSTALALKSWAPRAVNEYTMTRREQRN